MRLSADEFRRWPNKSVTLLGMSGVGKTWLANILRRQQWFHFSADYRIGTRYLDEPILDNIKLQAMQVPFLRDLLRSDSIHINNNITVDNLAPLSTFLGKLGDPDRGGLRLVEFKRRQRLHHAAEVAALKDVPEFIRKAREIYGYPHFVNDAGGSVCELDDPDVLETLAAHTLMLYIRASDADEAALIERARRDPKPLYYREKFLDEHLGVYMRERALEYVALVEPDDFVRWVFPRLFYARIPRYEAIAARHGYSLAAADVARIRDEADFLALVESVLAAQAVRAAAV
ncbi:MAG: ATPase [Gammaproteobacteria bacterium]